MKRTAIPALALALAGCSTATPGVQIRKVPTPVPVACVPREKIPPEPPSVQDMLTGDAETDIYIISASAGRLRIVVQELRSALLACAHG